MITGAGEAVFVSGADINDIRARTRDDGLAAINSTLFAAIDKCPKVTIAAVNGLALGGGCELALSCDIRVLGKNAKIGLTECSLGIIPGAGGTQRLPRLIGAALAKELIFTARRLTADDARALGMCNHVVDAGGALAKCKAIAAEITKCAPIAVEAAKAAIDGGLACGISEGLLLEQRAYEVTLYTEDRKEALKAFAEKRPPVFQGR